MKTLKKLCSYAALTAMLLAAVAVVERTSADIEAKRGLLVVALLGMMQAYRIVAYALWQTCEKEEEVMRLNDMLDKVYKKIDWRR